jgi:hypothetical protein
LRRHGRNFWVLCDTAQNAAYAGCRVEEARDRFVFAQRAGPVQVVSACLLLGKPIQQEIAERSYTVWVSASLQNPDKVLEQSARRGLGVTRPPA